MGSRIMHSIIGYRIASELRIENKQAFLLGSIAPDAVFTVEEKNASHYFIGDAEDHSRRVDVEGFLKEHHTMVDGRNDYILGYYTHLLADDIWLKGFYLSWLKNRMKEVEGLYQLYHQDFRLLNGKLLEHYGLVDDLRKAFTMIPTVPDLNNVKSKDVEELVPYLLGDMEYDQAMKNEKLQVFTFEQIIGYIETSVELGLYKLKSFSSLNEKEKSIKS